MVTLGGPRLNPQLAQQVFEVGLVDDDFAGRLPVGAGLDDAIIKGLEETHLGDRVFFRTRERATVFCGPALECRLVDEDLEEKGSLPVHRNGVGELAAGGAAALGTIALKEVILIHEAVSGGIAFDGFVYQYYFFEGNRAQRDRKSTRLNFSHPSISYAVFCL